MPDPDNPEKLISVEYLESCPYCEAGMDYEFPDIMSEAIRAEISRRQGQPIYFNNKYGDFIKRFAPLVHEVVDVTEEVATAACEWLISLALFRLKYTDKKGAVRPNTSYIWLAPSSSNKSTLKVNILDRIVYDLFLPDLKKILNRGTARGMASEISKIKSEPNERLFILLIKDEISTLFKDAKGNSDDTFEGLSGMYDGQIESNATVTNGFKRGTKIYCPMWGTGTPTQFPQVSEDFWKQGFAFRNFFLPIEYQDISPLEDKNLEKYEEPLKEMIHDLGEMRKLSPVRTTEEFLKQLNDYWMPLALEIRKAEKDPSFNPVSEKFIEILSHGKSPELLIKLSMIYATSRWNIKNGTLVLDVEDLQRAIQRYEYYHENFIQVFKYWILNRDTRDIRIRTEQLKEIFSKLKSRGKSWKTTPNTEGIPKTIAEVDPEGDWIRHSDLVHELSNKGVDSKTLQSLLTTWLEGEILAMRENVTIPSQRDRLSTFYKLIN